MANKDKLEGFAEHLYINEGWQQKDIAAYLGKSENTISAWKRNGRWDDRKMLVLAAPHRIKTLLLEHFEKLAKGEESKIDADAVSKVAKAIESLNDRISVQVIMSVFKDFDLYMVEQDPQLALKFTEYHRKFLLHKIQTDG